MVLPQTFCLAQQLRHVLCQGMTSWNGGVLPWTMHRVRHHGLCWTRCSPIISQPSVTCDARNLTELNAVELSRDAYLHERCKKNPAQTLPWPGTCAPHTTAYAMCKVSKASFNSRKEVWSVVLLWTRSDIILHIPIKLHYKLGHSKTIFLTHCSLHARGLPHHIGTCVQRKDARSP